MKNHHLTDDTDQTTFTAFNELWKLWKGNQHIGNDPHAWDYLTSQARSICQKAKQATDPDFIADFASAVLTSLDKINNHH